jgi:hypothetical protein
LEGGRGRPTNQADGRALSVSNVRRQLKQQQNALIARSNNSLKTISALVFRAISLVEGLSIDFG